MEMTLSQAADLIGIPQKRLYRAVKAGKLKAVQRHQGSRWEYLVTRQDLEDFERSTERLVDQDARPVATDPETGRPTEGPVDWDTRPTATDRANGRPTERPGGDHPPVELYLALVDRLQRAERRTVELELALRQSQRLLTENAESITEKEAKATEARAQLQALEDAKQLEVTRLATELETLEKSKQVEAERLSSELETTRRQLAEAQKPSGFFSWLGFRKKRSSESMDKAV
jgi:hypothetical protein